MEPLGGFFHSILKFEMAANNFIQCAFQTVNKCKCFFVCCTQLKHWFLLVCLSEGSSSSDYFLLDQKTLGLSSTKTGFNKDSWIYSFIYFFLIGFLSHQLLLLLGKRELLLRHLGNICKLELQKKKKHLHTHL